LKRHDVIVDVTIFATIASRGKHGLWERKEEIGKKLHISGGGESGAGARWLALAAKGNRLIL